MICWVELKYHKLRQFERLFQSLRHTHTHTRTSQQIAVNGPLGIPVTVGPCNITPAAICGSTELRRSLYSPSLPHHQCYQHFQKHHHHICHHTGLLLRMLRFSAYFLPRLHMIIQCEAGSGIYYLV